MGNELSTPPSLLSQQTTKLDTRPTSLAECIDEECLKAIQFLRYRQHFWTVFFILKPLPL